MKTLEEEFNFFFAKCIKEKIPEPMLELTKLAFYSGGIAMSAEVLINSKNIDEAKKNMSIIFSEYTEAILLVALKEDIKEGN